MISTLIIAIFFKTFLFYYNLNILELFMKARTIVLINARIFTAVNTKVIENGVIVIKNNMITDVGSRGFVEIPRDAEVIDVKGSFVMPGLIDAHAHLLGLKSGDEVKEPLLMPYEVLVIRSIKDLEALINSGFTTFVDAASIIALRLKYAIEEGTIIGPRIVAAGYPLTQTFGHADIHYLPIKWVDPRTTEKLVIPYAGLICDGPDECRKAARYALREGADFIKVMASGGVASERDRPEYIQFTIEELKAIVEEAKAAKRFVHAHAYPAEAIKNCINAGVKVIAHASFIDEEGIQLAKERNVIIVPTITIYQKVLEIGSKYNYPEWAIKKTEEIFETHIYNIRKAYKANVKIATGTDLLSGPFKHGENALEIKLLVDKIGMSPAEALIAATKIASEVAGLRDKIGTLEKGKLADIIAIKGNPLEHVETLLDPKNIVLVMKEGEILKNILGKE